MINIRKASFSYFEIYFVSLLFIFVGIILQPNNTLLAGLQKIYLSSSILITDYMEIAGMGAALFNSGSVLLFTIILLHILKARLTGSLVAALGMVLGFSLFGKNILNSFPLMLGVYLYSKYKQIDVANYAHIACFSTGISPLVTFIIYHLGWPFYLSIPAGILIGVMVGFIIIPLSSSMLKFHQGYNLYNVGFTLGIIGMAIVGFLRMFGYEIIGVRHVYDGDDGAILCLTLISFILIFLYGFVINGGFRGYSVILESTGQTISDFTLEANKGLVLINMGLLGLIGVLYVKICGGVLNGPLLGGIISIVGFGAFGKHPKNIIPVLMGVYLATKLNIYEMRSTETILIGLFGTTLAPVAGEYGFIAGICAGMLHKAIALNVSILHGGLNLYNNGLAGGFVAGLLVPFLENIIEKEDVSAE